MYVSPVLVGVFGTLIFEAILMTIVVVVALQRGHEEDEDNDNQSNE